MDLEKFRIGLVFRNHDIIVLGEYDDNGKMDENSMGVLEDHDSIYETLPTNKFGVVEVERNSEDEIALKDRHSYTIGDDEGQEIDSIMEIYREDPEEFYNIINGLYETIMNEIAQ